ncbi:hypothetical protein PF004_g21682 [Phytophthora fragariae]|uniref:Uncharacterized protein n=3 Tax=Phytophthora fragariae TaxID=53985 RepID=A0A6G0N392_9STRA|nr:hypothetical protein PF003_g37752 [Phytophthora fragariae]KAE8883724.1 hypothetical protein PF003_g32207 [Phytophthora fragariae]KAE9191160.1 hypothetical protein PF004_g21682 [Phytophthora fragariae]
MPRELRAVVKPPIVVKPPAAGRPSTSRGEPVEGSEENQGTADYFAVYKRNTSRSTMPKPSRASIRANTSRSARGTGSDSMECDAQIIACI